MPTFEEMKKYISHDPKKWNGWRTFENTKRGYKPEKDGRIIYTFEDEVVDLPAESIDLSCCRYFNVDFVTPHAVETDFTDAEFDRSTFKVLTMRSATFFRSKHHRTEFTDNDFEDVLFKNSELTKCSFENVKFAKCNLVQCEAFESNFSGSEAVNTDFEGCRLHQTTWYKTVYDECNFAKARFGAAQLINAKFYHSIFDDAQFAKATITGGHFKYGRALSANFQAATISDCDFVQVDLRGANFTKAEIDNVHFGGCDLRGANFVGTGIWGPEQLPGARVDETTIFQARPQDSLKEAPSKDEVTESAIFSADNPNALDLSEVSASQPLKTDKGTLDHHQVMSVNTPVYFTKADGTDTQITLASIAIAMRGKQNAIPEIFERVIKAAENGEDIRFKDKEEEWLELLTADWIAPEDKEACFEAIRKAMTEEHAAPYFGSLEWLTPENLETIREGLLFCQELGNGNVVIGAFKAGASVFSFGIFPVGLYHVHKIMDVLTNRFAAADRQRDKELEDS
ncbi:Uncharacterized protein YjbI, contains pentapeptide repeats [Pseudovibrio ascidiaceicola]|uniref:Uncharacterized protein YjbI, contains pentapeptide repeats n=1 Tax=Pseudovibrio ascidiaceicola TaxID=285279 RepID=A0A1I4E244_9HYPH|nr:pentapeptide repeat-containing protein [Pseudovibrio ascidiaceicola]SFK98637.1 Uncharacterized protein YjbI, contains pentapeptide repeats [Pseudovibrio ascidiaceicola]